MKQLNLWERDLTWCRGLSRGLSMGLFMISRGGGLSRRLCMKSANKLKRASWCLKSA